MDTNPARVSAAAACFRPEPWSQPIRWTLAAACSLTIAAGSLLLAPAGCSRPSPPAAGAGADAGAAGRPQPLPEGADRRRYPALEPAPDAGLRLDGQVLQPPPPLFVPGRSVGVLRLGMAEDELHRSMGKPQGTRRPSAGDGREVLYREPGLAVTLDRDGRVVALTLLGELADPFIRVSHPGRSAEGLGLQSAPEEFARAWGQPQITPRPSPYYEEGEVWSFPSKGAALLVGAGPDGKKQVMGLRIAP